MNDESLSSLFAKARSVQPETSRVEYGLETRLQARLARLSPAARQPVLLWSWRLLPFFAMLAITLSWSAWQQAPEEEIALQHALEEESAEWVYVAGLTGRYL